MIAIIFWLILSVMVGFFASAKGRSGIGFFITSVIFSPLIGLIIVLVISPNITKVETTAIESGQLKKCPYCAETVRVEAKKCKHCQSELAA